MKAFVVLLQIYLLTPASGRLNLIVLVVNLQSASFHLPVLDVMLPYLEKKYPLALRNYSVETIQDLGPTVLSTEERFNTAWHMTDLYRRGRLQEKGALTVVFDPSKSTLKLTKSKVYNY